MAINSPVRGRSVTRTDRRDRLPIGIEIAAGAGGLIVAGLIAASIPASYPQWRFGVMAAVVALFAAMSLDQVGVAAIGVFAFAISDGFLEDQYGQLSWHGSDDVRLLLLLVIACGWGLAVGEAARLLARLRDQPRNARLRDRTVSTPRDTLSTKEKHSA